MRKYEGNAKGEKEIFGINMNEDDIRPKVLERA